MQLLSISGCLSGWPLSTQEKYVRENDSKKVNMLLISKADLLTSNQRYAHTTYDRILFLCVCIKSIS